MYTSKLPRSTMRPSSQLQSTSKIPNIPQTVRKLNLFTPQTKHRSFSMEHSTAGKSSISGLNTDRKVYKPLKPQPDKDEQMKMFQDLVDYIRKNAPGMTPPEAKKFFSSVSTTETLRIFQLLISRRHPDLKVDRLDDIPNALTILQYPYVKSVTKSSLVSITTRQGAVGLLVVFNWLIKQITARANISQYNNTSITTQYCKIVITQAERIDEAKQELREKLLPIPDVEAARSDLEAVEYELKELKLKKETKDKLDLDLIEVSDNNKRMEDHLQQVKEKLKENLENKSKLNIQLESLKDIIQERRLRVSNHKYRIENVQILQDKLNILESKIQKSNEKIKELEMNKVKIEHDRKKLSDDFKNKKSIYLELLETFVEIYKYDFEFKIPDMDEIRMLISNKISELKRMDDNDHWSHYKKIFDELYSIFRELRSQNPTLIEAKEYYQDKLETLEKSYNNTIAELKRLDGESRRIDEEGRNEILKSENDLAKLDQNVQNLQIKLEEIKSEYKTLESKLNQEKEIALKGLQMAKEQSSESRAINNELLIQKCNRIKQEQANILESAEEDVVKWQKFHKITMQNNRVLRTKFVKLNERLVFIKS